jgi:glycosyltransferase involved in cell wall biosynthesis
MRLAVITPVGPGHEGILPLAAMSVMNLEKGPFDEILHVIVNDNEGKLGRSKARNIGIQTPADWYFLLDADDIIMPYAPRLLERTPNEYSAVFGAVQVNGRVTPQNKWPCRIEHIYEHGGLGTLCMGFFIKAEVARNLLFDETLDKGEDFDFYMRLPSFYKLKVPLVSINGKIASAVGPRGYEELDWIATCREVVERYRR